MHQHDQSPPPDVVDQPGETDEDDGGDMVNYLLFEILKLENKRDCVKIKISDAG